MSVIQQALFSLDNRIEYIGYVHGTTSTQSNLTLTLPVNTKPIDTIFVHIVYENSTASRPTISGFTTLQSRNGTFSGSLMTHVLLQGSTSNSTITIPNDATYNGCAVSCVVLRYVKSVTASGLDSSADSSTSTDYVRSIPNGGAFIILAGLDDATPSFTTWNSDSDFDYNATYLSGDGADPGRACYSGVALGPTSSVTYSTGNPNGIGTSGVHHAYIDITGAV